MFGKKQEAETVKSSINSGKFECDFFQLGNGNTQNNYYNHKYFDPPEINQFKDESRVTSFPESVKQYSQNFLSGLEHYRQFYSQHRWIICVQNTRNLAEFFDMLYQLISADSDKSYRYQPEPIECRDYIQHGDLLKYDKPTITRVPVKEQSLFFEFFKEPEQVAELSRQLSRCNNTLLFTVNEEENPGQVAQLKKYLKSDKREYAVWTPEHHEKSSNQQDIVIDNLSVVQRSILAIATTFNSLPYSQFQRLLYDLLKEQAEVAKATSDKETYPEWWPHWLQNRDQYFNIFGICNCCMLDEDTFSLRFSSSGDQAFYRDVMFKYYIQDVVNLWPKIKYLFFQNNDWDIPAELWNQLSVELAAYLENLHKQGLLCLDARFLMTLYESVRYARHNNLKFFLRFSYLVKHLYKKRLCENPVIEFIQHMQHNMNLEEQQLISSINYNLDILGSLPKQMPELARIAEAVDKEAARELFFLKDRIYATCILLDTVFGVGGLLFLNSYVQVFKNDFGQSYIKRRDLPTNGIFSWFLKNQLSDSVVKLLQLSALLKDYENPKDSQDVFLIARAVLINALDSSKSFNLTGVKGLNYLYELLSHETGVDTVIYLLYSPSFQLEDQEDQTERLILTLIRMRQLLIVQDRKDKRLDVLMQRLMQLSAENLPREQYKVLSEVCLDLLTRFREQIITADRKSEKKSFIAFKDASLFIKKAFRRNRESTI